jgi:hypothetical protein
MKDAGEIFSKLFQSILIAIATYFATEFSNLARSIQELNQNVAVLIERTTTQSQEIVDIKTRLIKLETK